MKLLPIMFLYFVSGILIGYGYSHSEHLLYIGGILTLISGGKSLEVFLLAKRTHEPTPEELWAADAAYENL